MRKVREEAWHHRLRLRRSQARRLLRIHKGKPYTRDLQSLSVAAGLLSGHHGSKVPMAGQNRGGYAKNSAKKQPYAVCRGCGHWVYLKRMGPACVSCGDAFSKSVLDKAKALQNKAGEKEGSDTSSSQGGGSSNQAKTNPQKLLDDLKAMVPEFSALELPAGAVVPTTPGADPRKEASRNFQQAFDALQNIHREEARIAREIAECESKLLAKRKALEDTRVRVLEAKRLANDASNNLAVANQRAVENAAVQAETPAERGNPATIDPYQEGTGTPEQMETDDLEQTSARKRAGSEIEDEAELAEFKSGISTILLANHAGENQQLQAGELAANRCEKLYRDLATKRRLRLRGKAAPPEEVPVSGWSSATSSADPQGSVESIASTVAVGPAAPALPVGATGDTEVDLISAATAQALLQKEDEERRQQLMAASAAGGVAQPTV